MTRSATTILDLSPRERDASESTAPAPLLGVYALALVALGALLLVRWAYRAGRRGARARSRPR